MSAPQSDVATRDESTEANTDVPYPVLLLQVTLGALFFVMVLGWILLTTNAIFDNRPATRRSSGHCQKYLEWVSFSSS